MEPSHLGPAFLDRGQGEAEPHLYLMYQQANTIWQENPTIWQIVDIKIVNWNLRYEMNFGGVSYSYLGLVI